MTRWKEKTKPGLSTVMLLLALTCAAATAQDVKSTTDIAVVVNAQNPETNISKTTLRKILLGEQHSWSNKSGIDLVLREPGNSAREAVLGGVAGMNEKEYKDYWFAKIYRGEATSEPLSVPSDGLASEYVSSKSGAIAFMPGTDVRKDAKVLKVDGLLPGAPGYALK